jgi:hypothetical protein
VTDLLVNSPIGVLGITSVVGEVRSLGSVGYDVLSDGQVLSEHLGTGDQPGLGGTVLKSRTVFVVEINTVQVVLEHEVGDVGTHSGGTLGSGVIGRTESGHQHLLTSILILLQ